jgi:glycosyltransferase involved in cell wall biosynthesis
VDVLLCTEGTYPFVDGGVGTWCDSICRELPQVEFTLYALTGTPEVTYKYELPPNARKLVHVPLWGAQEPAEFILRDLPYAEIGRRKEATTDEAVEGGFLPLFRGLLAGMATAGPDIRDYGVVVYELWRWFREHDWKLTWRSPLVYEAFVAHALERARDAPAYERPSVADLNTSLHWFDNFLLPLAAPLPETDLVHSTLAGFAGLPGIVAKHRDGTPFLVTEHGVFVRERYISVSTGDFSPYAKRFLMELTSFVAKLNYSHADLVAPVGEFNRRWEVPHGVDPGRIRVIYNGVDPGDFVPKPKPPATSRRPTVVAAARVFPLKDVETMIRSAGVARALRPDVQFLVYGSLEADPPYVERCRALIRELALEDMFELRGFHSKPPELYTEGDLSVLSSISEGFPYTVLESMACMRPVAGTDVGGVSEALEGFGIVVPPRDPEALGRAVVQLLDDGEFRGELGRRAREEVLAKYRTSRSVNAYWDVYRSLAAAALAA